LSQFCIVYKLAECAFCLIIQVTNKDVKQYCPQYQPLGDQSLMVYPTVLHAADHNTKSSSSASFQSTLMSTCLWYTLRKHTGIKQTALKMSL